MALVAVAWLGCHALAAYRRAEANRTLRAAQLHEAGLEDDADRADAAAYEDRKWDDWRDDHTRGSGVTKRV